MTIALGNRLEPFIDRHLIDTLDGADLRLQRPMPANVALRYDKPWEGAFCCCPTVLHDGDRYLLYYRGWATGDKNSKQRTCLAISEDGIEFHRPSLNLFEFEGSKDNNIILADVHCVHNFSPLIDPRPNVPGDERFKALGHGPKLQPTDRPNPLQAWKSPDGIHWSLMREEPVITKGAFDSQNIAFWSEHEGCFVSYYRTCHGVPVTQMGGGPRTVSRAVSDDFVHWSDPVEMDYGNTPREEIYMNQTHPYFRAPHIYLSLAKRLVQERSALSDAEGQALGICEYKGTGYWKGVSEGVLMSTRGGSHYDRTFMEAFMRPGLDRANWVSRCNMAALNVVPTSPHEMSLYYHHRYASPSQYLQRYTLRADGFASVHASYQGGTMTTRPVTFAGRELILNYSTSAVGGVRVELLDAAGKVLPGFALEDCDVIFGDHIERAVTWRGSSSVAAHADKPVRLRFTLNDADLYSIRFR